MMNLQNYYTVDLYLKFSPTLRKFFILHCPDDIMKFFCDCVFNVVKGKVKLDKRLQQKAALLAREKTNLEKICSKRRVALKRKRQVLGSERGLRLLKLVLPSVLNHLEYCHGIEQ